MYARLMHLNVKPEKIEEAVKNYEVSIENSKRQKGYKAGILIADPNTGKAYSVSLWDTEEDVLDGHADGYYEKQMEIMGDVWSKPPHREVYQVSVVYLSDELR